MMKQWPLLIIFLCYTGLNGAAPVEQTKEDKEAEDTYVRKICSQYMKLFWMEESTTFKNNLRLQWRQKPEDEKLAWKMENCTLQNQ